MLFSVGATLLVAYLPGAFVFRAPFADRPRRAALAADERVFWAIVISLAWSLTVALALAAAGAYTFGRVLLLNAGGCLTIAGLARGRLRYVPTASGLDWTALVPAGLVAIGLALFFPPAEHIQGGKDPGVYISEGIQIAQRGSLVIHDDVVASVPPEFRDLFFPSHGNPAYYGLRFMGFFILDPATGKVVGQFPHLYPASLALAYGLDGLTGVRRATGVWALLGVLAVYYAGARLVGRRAAGAAAALLTVNVVQVWFARDPNAEVVMQAFLFAALLANARAHVDGDSFFAPVAGALLALLLFLRVDAVLALASVGGAAALGWLDGRRTRRAFVVTAGGGLALAGLYLTILMKPYAAFPLAFVGNRGPLALFLALAAVVGALTLGIAARRPAWAAWLRALVPRALVIAVVAAAVYAYFLREAAGRTALHDAMALRTFAWYITGAGLLAASIGYAIVVGRSFWRDPALLLTATAFGLFFFYKIRIVPEHFWMTRRFLSVILPTALLLASAGAFAVLGDQGPLRLFSRRAGRAATGQRPALILHGLSLALPWLFLGALGWQFVRATQPIRSHVEYAGLIPHLEQLAQRFERQDLVIVESRSASDVHVLALPLAYIYARNVLVLDTPRPDATRFAAFLSWARTRYRAIFFLGGGGTDLLSRSIAVTAVSGERFQVPEYESPVNQYPRRVRYKEFDFGIYRFSAPRGSVGWFTLDVGTMDDLHVVRFHAKERMAARTFRWSRDVSYISITDMREDNRLVTLWLENGGRPPAVEPARVAVSLNDQLLGEVTVTSGVRPYSFAIPAVLAAEAAQRQEAARLKLETNTWSPRAALGTADDRQLGVMVDRVEVR